MKRITSLLVGVVALGAFVPACTAAPRPQLRDGDAAIGATPSGAEVRARGPVITEPRVASTPVELGQLDVVGFGPAVVAAPAARAEPYPLLVVAHGAGDRPEWHCELWRDLAGGRGFVLCPRGRATDARAPFERAQYYFPDHHYLAALLEASLSALEAAFSTAGAARVDTSGVVFAGYSQGATMGALVLATSAARFPRGILVEGGFNQWNVAISTRYRRGGGACIALVCGGIGCALSAAEGARWLEQGGVRARMVHVEGAGHTPFGLVAERLPEVLDWAVADDPRWNPAPPRPR